MMAAVSDGMLRSLEDFGAVPSQMVNLASPEDPRAIRYVDLVRAPPPGGAPVVIESQAQPCVYVFNGTSCEQRTAVKQWIRRVAFRGDADWMGIWRPGRLDIFRSVLDGRDTPTPVTTLQGRELLPTLLHTPSERVSGHVRARLLDLLLRSIVDAKNWGVGPNDALSLVGRALFWRFLIDRGLLDGLRRDVVCPGAESWSACLASRENALHTFNWLDDTFNGGLLPFDVDPSTFDPAVYSGVVGNIAYGADATGQLSLRLPEAWSDVNFAHVPVGLLSEVYEAFAHDASARKARAESVFYTPRNIAEYVVQEALDAIGNVERPRVLDPAVGAGVFLITMFRALVAREWSLSKARPARSAIRRILNTQLTGFDINSSALRLTELGLYLTAIELDPDPRPRPLKLLRFEPPLRGRALFELSGGVNRGSLAPVDPHFRGEFDIVLGNPPWTASASLAATQEWVAASFQIVKHRLGTERAEAFDLPQKTPDLAFVYRAMEWAKPEASIALITHARWLFGQSPKIRSARDDLLGSLHVTGILNGAALRDTNVWPNVRHPFAIIFAVNERPPPGSAFLFVSPELDHIPDGDQERMRLDFQDAREVVSEEVIERPWMLKTRFRGGPFDESTIEAVKRRGVSLHKYLKTELRTRLCNGYKVGGIDSPQMSASHLHDLKDLRGHEPDFFINAASLPPFERPTLHRPRKRQIYRKPLLIINESVRVDRMLPRAALSMDDVVYDERFDAISFADVADGAEIAAYLHIVLQSSIFRHLFLMVDEQLGVEREVVQKRTIDAVPVVPWRDLSKGQRIACRKLSARLWHGMNLSLAEDIDTFTFDLFELSNVQRDAVRDTLSTALPTAAEKKFALQSTTGAQREEFAATCQTALQDVLSASGIQAQVRVREELRFGFWNVIQVDRYTGKPPGLATLDVGEFLAAADEAAASLVVVGTDARTTLIGLLDRYRYWTPTRARVLAASLLSEDDRDA